jgi:GDPmannose 4,6-dehydratase
MTTALITGVTGQDGSYLAELLSGKGYHVVGTSRAAPGNSAATALSGERCQLDLANAANVRELVAQVRPDHIYHLAGQSSVGLSFAEPSVTFVSIASSTLHVLEAVRLAAPEARLFVASSGEVFGDTGSTAADEATPFRPLSPYAAAKAAAAELVRAYRASYGLFASVGYLYNHESPRRPERFVTRKIVRAACEIAAGLRQEVELGDLSVVRDWGWAPEYVDAIARVLDAAEADDFVIATGQSHPLSKFVDLVFSELGLDWKKHVVTQPALFRPAEARALRANPAHAATRLRWQAETGLEGVARRMVEHERALLASVAEARQAPP